MLPEEALRAGYTPVVGFDPHRRIRRARMTRRGDLLFLGGFLVLTIALIVWAAW